MVNKEREDRVGHVGFVKEEEKSDVKRFYVDEDYTQNRHRINEQEIGLSLGGERLIVRHGDRDDHLYLGGQNDIGELERVERLRQREKRLQELEEEFAVREREMEYKRLLLEQRLEAKRKLKYTQAHEEETLLREEKLKHKFQQMKEKERELEKIEASLLETGTIERAAEENAERPLVDQKKKTGDNEYRKKQEYMNEDELVKILVKDRTVLSESKRSDRVLENDSSAIGDKNTTDQHKVREKRITMEKNIFFSKFTPFSGDDNRPKGDASYEEWRYEVKCNIRDKV